MFSSTHSNPYNRFICCSSVLSSNIQFFMSILTLDYTVVLEKSLPILGPDKSLLFFLPSQRIAPKSYPPFRFLQTSVLDSIQYQYISHPIFLVLVDLDVHVVEWTSGISEPVKSSVLVIRIPQSFNSDLDRLWFQWIIVVVQSVHGPLPEFETVTVLDSSSWMVDTIDFRSWYLLFDYLCGDEREIEWGDERIVEAECLAADKIWSLLAPLFDLGRESAWCLG